MPNPKESSYNHDSAHSEANGKDLTILGRRLTAAQDSQLTNIVKKYLKENGVQFSYDNFTKSIPIIGNCVLKGLIEIKGSNIIRSEDNLIEAYKIGSKERDTLKTRAKKELSGSTQRGELESNILVIPATLREQADQELEKIIFILKPEAIKKYLAMVDQRRPTYNKLLKLARDRVEESIPNSKDAQLSDKESAALVRNLIFCWVSLNEPRALIETEEIMTNKNSFMSNLNKDVNLIDLAKLANIKLDAANIAYLNDLIIQVKELLQGTPTQTDSLNLINAGFNQLKEKFLVVNPFYKLTDISEISMAGNPSIWDNDKSTLINFSGTNYRIPNPQTLKVLSLKRSVDNQKRSRELIVGAKLAELLFSEFKSRNESNQSKTLREKMDNLNASLQNIKNKFSDGKIPKELTFSNKALEKYAEIQLKTIRDEKQIYELTRKCNNQLLAIAFELLNDYKDGRPAKTTEEILALNSLFYAPSLLVPKIRLFLRDRVLGRLRLFERIHFAKNITTASPDLTSEQYLDQAVDTTNIDILSSISELWTRELLNPQNLLTESEKQIIWQRVIEIEERKINDEVSGIMWRNKQNKVDEKTNTFNEIVNRFEHIKNKVDEIKTIKRIISDGQLPAKEEKLKKFMMEVQSKYSQDLKSGSISWNEKFLFSNFIQDVIDGKEYFRMGKWSDDSLEADTNPAISNLTTQENGPLKMIISTICRLTPTEFLPDVPTSLEQLVHNKVPNRVKPFSYRKDRIPERKALSEKLREYLKKNGISFTDEKYKEIIMPDTIDEFEENLDFWPRFWKTEVEVKKWFDLQKERLKSQIDENPLILESSPNEEVRSIKIKIDKIEKNIISTQNYLNKKITEKIEQLRKLNLIREEK